MKSEVAGERGHYLRDVEQDSRLHKIHRLNISHPLQCSTQRGKPSFDGEALKGLQLLE